MDHPQPSTNQSFDHTCHEEHDLDMAMQIMKNKTFFQLTTPAEAIEQLREWTPTANLDEKTQLLERVVYVQTVLEAVITTSPDDLHYWSSVVHHIFRFLFERLPESVFEKCPIRNCPIYIWTIETIESIIQLLTTNTIYQRELNLPFEAHIEAITKASYKFNQVNLLLALNNIFVFLCQLQDKPRINMYYMRVLIYDDPKEIILCKYNHYEYDNYDDEPVTVSIHPSMLHLALRNSDDVNEEWIQRFKTPINVDSEPCAVCLEIISPQQHVVLSACRHMFCLPCHKRWMNEKEGEINCPLCRTVSADYIQLSGYDNLQRTLDKTENIILLYFAFDFLCEIEYC